MEPQNKAFEPLTIKGPELNDILGSVYSFIFEKGRAVFPRGQEVLEWSGPMMLEISRNSHPWTFIPERRLNPYFSIAEVIWILAGRGDVEFISYFNKNMKTFSDDGKGFHAAYGERLRKTPIFFSDEETKEMQEDYVDQVELVVERLSKDPSSRQAVLCLWDPARDLKQGYKDYPCNNLCYFTLRDGLLLMSVVRRSNDMIWGLPYNQIQFYFIQAMIAGSLRVEMGPCVEYVQNMHVYTKLYPSLFRNLLELSTNGIDITIEKRLEPVDRRISLDSFKKFEAGFWPAFANATKNPESVEKIFSKLRSDLVKNSVSEFWADNMAALPLAFVARKHGSIAAHNEILKNIEPALEWLVLDFNDGKQF